MTMELVCGAAWAASVFIAGDTRNMQAVWAICDARTLFVRCPQSTWGGTVDFSLSHPVKRGISMYDEAGPCQP